VVGRAEEIVNPVDIEQLAGLRTSRQRIRIVPTKVTAVESAPTSSNA